MLMDGLEKGDCRYFLFNFSSICKYRIVDYHFRLGKESGSLRESIEEARGSIEDVFHRVGCCRRISQDYAPH